ncbi:chemotaxis protein CheY [Clostridium acetireducens DSM 10703]|jgi:two-component system chemotaxis response regulator CheY|uniref:Stage 0 sporulation protein A homolog n=1 Tax=Clostridium acetireducens DSM 10703 TaxID=1121290 RepID=A0A1E8F0P4_9CLOT|nr:response regulator [Clostridium acetireducens]OFI06996.1 chemotaxis protein CheY [Clostridium acetireducens DSM 10703]
MKILIVDDSAFAQKSVLRLLKVYLKEVEFYTATSGKEALEIYKEQNPDFSFIDLLMPEMSGQELIANIKKINKDSKIFVMSADVQKSVKEEVKSLGVISFINKPFNKEKAMEVCEFIKG